MLRFCANVATMYRGLSVPDAMLAARRDGFSAVEAQWIEGVAPEKLAALRSEHDLTFVQFNTAAGHRAEGELGVACLPGREDEFRRSIDMAIEYADALGCRQVNCPVGRISPDFSLLQQEDVLVANLAEAAEELSRAGIRLQIEPLNRIDNPGVFLSTTADYERVAARVAHPNLFLQLDFYHLQVSQGDLTGHFRRLQERINHVQIADHPGRHEPGSGEINYRFVLSELERLGYADWVGCEYVPASTVPGGLDWLRPYRPQP